MIDPSCPFRLKPRWNHGPRSDSNPIGQGYWKTGTIQYAKIPELAGVDLDQYRGAEREETRVAVQK